MADKQDVELGKSGTPAPPILKQARLGSLDLFRAELESSDHPLDFTAGVSVYANRTSLHLAAMQGHEDIVKFILSRPGVSRDVVNAKDQFGYTPLHLAVRHSHAGVVKLLTTSPWLLPDRFLATTSEPDDLNESYGGYTPLHLAAVKGDPTIARILLRQPCRVEFPFQPADLRAVTWSSDTPLDLAQQQLLAERLKLCSRFRKVSRVRLKILAELVDVLESADMVWLKQERDRHAMSANAILVGAALVASAAFGSWLQPPGGIPASDSASSNSDKSRNSVFFTFAAFAFAYSVVALVLGTLATFPYTATSLKVEVQQLRRTVRLAQWCLLMAICALVYCFSYAGSIVLGKVASISDGFSSTGTQIITWLPLITLLFILHYFYGYAARLVGIFGFKMRVWSLLNIVGLGCTLGLAVGVPRPVSS